ncbi:class I SAM-dependent methyltransferase [Streptomyces sp. NPDC048639]|uniref:class I SAM-dependent methyltransferase n=1 Tax=Streptomyces sp. NPDC048639 TaxID=3365581 RepID=UPI00370FE8DE
MTGTDPRRDPDEDARRLSAESLADDDPTGWFERLYAAAEGGGAIVPWDRGGPHPMLVEWLRDRPRPATRKRALVVGCGPGFDAELLAGYGFDTTAFDISASAIAAAHRRFPGSAVRYRAADLLDPPAEWRGAFDLVVEILTVQALPDPVRRAAIDRVAEMTGPGGTLLAIAAARDEDGAPEGGPPWPLTRREIDAFAAGPLEAVRVEDVRLSGEPGRRRWRAEFHRPRPAA